MEHFVLDRGLVMGLRRRGFGCKCISSDAAAVQRGLADARPCAILRELHPNSWPPVEAEVAYATANSIPLLGFFKQPCAMALPAAFCDGVLNLSSRAPENGTFLPVDYDPLLLLVSRCREYPRVAYDDMLSLLAQPQLVSQSPLGSLHTAAAVPITTPLARNPFPAAGDDSPWDSDDEAGGGLLGWLDRGASTATAEDVQRFDSNAFDIMELELPLSQEEEPGLGSGSGSGPGSGLGSLHDAGLPLGGTDQSFLQGPELLAGDDSERPAKRYRNVSLFWVLQSNACLMHPQSTDLPCNRRRKKSKHVNWIDDEFMARMQYLASTLDGYTGASF